MSGTGLEVIAVAVDAGSAVRDLRTLLDRLARELGPAPGPRLLFLPPLLANLAALPADLAEASLPAAVVRAARRRVLRRLAVRFAYPSATPNRRAWLTMHDRVHAVLRGPIADLARRAGAVVLGGTAVCDHPRTHWEAWPDTGNLFHAAWCFATDGEPAGVLRQRQSEWAALAGADVDPARGEGGDLIATPLGDVAVAWSGAAHELSEAPIVWRPHVRVRGASTGEGPRELLRAAPAAAQVVARSCLAGRLGAPLSGRAALLTRGPGGAWP